VRTYGPLSLTTNTITPVSVPNSSTFVYIGNDSPYDVLVSFLPSQPPVSTTAVGDWTGVVQAFHHGNFPTPANLQSPLGGGFTGRVWLLPLDTRSAGLSTTGSISALANLWVIATEAGEQPPDAYAAPRQTDLSSQPRIVAVPPSTAQTMTGEATFTAAGQVYTPIGAVVAAPPSPATQFDGATTIVVYLYSLHFVCSAAILKYRLRLVCTDHASVVLSNSDMFYGQCSTTMPNVFTPYFPFSYAFAPPATTTNVSLNIYAAAISANPTTLELNLAMEADVVSGIPVPAIGGGLTATPYVSGVPSGVRF
jgi:hypothetical protein